MLKFSIKRKWISGLFGVIFAAILFLWIPFLWHGKVEFDRDLFATEYYKTLVDVGKILFGFWLANIFFQKIQMEEFVGYFKTQWQIQKTVLLGAVQALKNIPNNFNVNVKDLMEKIELSDMRLCYLSEMISSYTHKDKLGPLGMEAYGYKKELHLDVARILVALKKGEIIELRPLDDEISNCTEELIAKLSV